MKIVLDCAHGATYKVAPSVFKELGAQVVVLSAQPDGLNINENCGSTHMGQLQAAVVAEGADLGIAFDGDGDRVLMVDHTGAVVDGDELLFIIALYAPRVVMALYRHYLGLEPAGDFRPATARHTRSLDANADSTLPAAQASVQADQY